jgi:phage virion morphogenesis protein
VKNKYFEVNFDSKIVTDFLKSQLKALDEDFPKLMKLARVIMKEIVDENFETEGVHTGEKWKEWSDSWKKKRLAMGKSTGRILNLDGTLRRSILADSGHDWARVGTNKVYAAIHNYGGNSALKHNKTMPKREFMRLDKPAMENLYGELYVLAKELLIDKEIKKKVYGE